MTLWPTTSPSACMVETSVAFAEVCPFLLRVIFFMFSVLL